MPREGGKSDGGKREKEEKERERLEKEAKAKKEREEKEKKTKYNQRILEVEHGSFTPMLNCLPAPAALGGRNGKSRSGFRRCESCYFTR